MGKEQPSVPGTAKKSPPRSTRRCFCGRSMRKKKSIDSRCFWSASNHWKLHPGSPIAVIVSLLLIAATVYAATCYMQGEQILAIDFPRPLQLWWNPGSHPHPRGSSFHGQLSSLSVSPKIPFEQAKVKRLLDASSRPSELPDICEAAQHIQFRGRGAAPNRVKACNEEKAKLSALPRPLDDMRYIPYWTKFHRLLTTANNEQFDWFHSFTVRDLLKSVKKRIDEYASKTLQQSVDSNRPYNSCAVVGNSGILFNKSYGRYIDSHEMVVRLNYAETRGFEKFVGQKCSLLFLHEYFLHDCASRGFTCSCQPYMTRVPIVASVLTPEYYMDVAVCNFANQYPVIITDVLFDKMCTRLARWYSLKHFIATTKLAANSWNRTSVTHSIGMQAVVLALSICNRVDLFGFSGMATQELQTYDVWSKNPGKIKQDLLNASQLSYDVEGEFMFYNDLLKTSKSAIPHFLKASGIHLPRVQLYR